MIIFGSLKEEEEEGVVGYDVWIYCLMIYEQAPSGVQQFAMSTCLLVAECLGGDRVGRAAWEGVRGWVGEGGGGHLANGHGFKC